tara:strand:+ start:27523 stop:27750 length:228 start_codon:yes stop_codon:yes gene_type:complete
MTDTEPKPKGNHPTMLIQFTGNEGEVLPVDPSIIAGILIPILGRIADSNECNFEMKYGSKPSEILDEVFPEDEEE